MDSDSERLPAGFERTGYDADTETYTFRGPDGRAYESEPGNRYGELWPVGEPRPQRSRFEDEAQSAAIKKDTRESLRMMLPFALVVFVFLILLFKLVNRGSGDGTGEGIPQLHACAEGSHQIQIHKGDTCWGVAENHGLSVDELLAIGGNDGVDCDRLHIGQTLCVPV